MYLFIIFIYLTVNGLSCFSQENRSGSLYPIRDFSSLLGQIQGLNDGLLSMHFKLYEGYVKNTNMLMQTLAEMRDQGEEGSIAFGALKKNFVMGV